MVEQFPRELTDHERAISRMAIGTMSIGWEQALAQLEVARHGGPAHSGTHPCFEFDVPADVHLIPRVSRYPLSLNVAADQYTVGTIELFIVDGRLGSLEWSEVSLTHNAPEVTEFPTLDRISAEPEPDSPSNQG